MSIFLSNQHCDSLYTEHAGQNKSFMLTSQTSLIAENIMPFHFNIKKQYKIWFSPEPSQFLPMRHQLRLIQAVQTNPGIELRLVYSKTCLNERAMAEMTTFCLKHNVIPLEVESVFSLTAGVDQQIAEIALREITCFIEGEGGNLGAASDCVRLLRPIIETCGIYSDFDVRNTLISLLGPNPTSYWIQLVGPVLFFGVQHRVENQMALMCNNDFLAFSLSFSKQSPDSLSLEANQCITNMQSALLAKYSMRLSMALFLNLCVRHLCMFDKEKASNATLRQFVDMLKQDSTSRTIFSVRKHLLHLMESHPDKFIQSFLHECFKQSVTRFSGPEIYPNLFAHLVSPPEVDSLIPIDSKTSAYRTIFTQSSIGYYDQIYDQIHNKNEAYRVLKDIRSGEKVGGELSWVPSGHRKIIADSEDLNIQAHKIGLFWKQKRPMRLIGEGASRILALPPLLQSISDKNYALALRKAVVGGETAVVRCLLECRKKQLIQFDINGTSSNGRTALDWVILTETLSPKIKKGIINLLRSAGAQTKVVPDEPGEVAIHGARV